MEKGKDDLLSRHHIWKGLVKIRLRDIDFSLLLLKSSRCPLCPFCIIIVFFQGLSSQERQTGKEGMPKADV
jgi:hypothetical protein